MTQTAAETIAPRNGGAGTIEVRIDSQTHATVDLSTPNARQAQQSACEIANLTLGEHVIELVNRGPGPVAVDALVIR